MGLIVALLFPFFFSFSHRGAVGVSSVCKCSTLIAKRFIINAFYCLCYYNGQ